MLPSEVYFSLKFSSSVDKVISKWFIFLTLILEYVILKTSPACLTEFAHSFSSTGIGYHGCFPSTLPGRWDRRDGAKPLLSAPTSCPPSTLPGEGPAKFQDPHLNCASPNIIFFLISTNTLNWLYYMPTFATNTAYLTQDSCWQNTYFLHKNTLSLRFCCIILL